MTANSIIVETVRAIEGLEVPYDAALNSAKQRQTQLTKPVGSLGKLELLALRVVGITGNMSPVLKNKIIYIAAGEHGVTDENISAYPQTVTPQMVSNFLSGGAAINVLANQLGIGVLVVNAGVYGDFAPHHMLIDLGIPTRTANIRTGPAMTNDVAAEIVSKGIELISSRHLDEHIDIVGLGEMGIGNSTSASAIISANSKLDPMYTTGIGTGLDEAGHQRKIQVIRDALEINQTVLNKIYTDPIEKSISYLAAVGGHEIAALTGIALGAAANRIPIVADGLISTAAILLAQIAQPKLANFVIPSHSSTEPGHSIALDSMQLDHPLLDLEMRLGEGTGAALAIGFCDLACHLLNDMSTFDEAEVDQSNQSK